MKNLGLVQAMASRFLRAPAPLRTFSSAAIRHDILKIPKVPVTPLSTRDLVSFKPKVVLPENVTPLLEAPELYARIHIHNWSLLVTEGDIVKLPVNMKDVAVGDTLVLDQVSEIGSRNYTLSGERIDPQVFSIKAAVMEKTRVKRSVTERTRRRRRHVRHVVANNSLTVLRISELRVIDPKAPSTD